MRSWWDASLLAPCTRASQAPQRYAFCRAGAALQVSHLLAASPAQYLLPSAPPVAISSTGDVKIIGMWASPFVLRPRIAFNLKGVEYEVLEENLSDKSDLLLKSNPVYKKVPVLLHGGRAICESTIILQYIDDVWNSPAPLLPADPYDRAIHRFWASYVDDNLFQAMMGIARAQTEEAKREQNEQWLSVVKPLEEAFEKCSNGKGFFNGDSVGYLDITLGSFCAWFRVMEEINGAVKLLDTERTPLLAGWEERFCAHEAVKGMMPETKKLIHFLKTVLEPKWKTATATGAAAAAK